LRKVPGKNEEKQNLIAELAENYLYDELLYYMRENSIPKDEDLLFV
jgi:hypothetical protein